ncbi:unnamed protein product, partial [Didymodactylos carnosus]
EISTLESSLPNELYDFIFLYLKSVDSIYSFFNLNDRFNHLIYPFLCAINLSDADEYSLNKYYQTILPKIHYYIKAIKVDDKNVDFVFPLSLYSKIYPNLESVFITKVEKNGKYLLYLKLFKQLLNLKIHFAVQEYNETVSNEFANYDYLELLLSHCCPNLERLALNLYSHEFIDGERLEKKLLLKLTKLKVFHFCFRIPVLDNTLNIDDYIQTYKSSFWINNHHSILCFNQPLHNQYYCVFSLPYAFERLSCVTNDLVNYRSNVNDDISLYSNQAKDIAFYDRVPFTLELFQIIQKSCLKATGLTFIVASIRFFSDNLMNNELILENIVDVWLFLDQLKYKYFRRLLLMTPNILRLFIVESLLLDIISESQTKPNAFQELQSICNPIRHVFIGRGAYEYDASKDNGRKLLFPNAILSGW